MKTPPKVLKELLEKVAAKDEQFTEKLEILDSIATQLHENIKSESRMKLKLSDLQDLLEREGYSRGKDKDAIYLVTTLFELRADQLVRLGKNYATKEFEEKRQELALLPAGKVYDLFAPEPPCKKTPEPPRNKSPEPPRKNTPEPPRNKSPEPPRKQSPEPPHNKSPEPPRKKEDHANAAPKSEAKRGNDVDSGHSPAVKKAKIDQQPKMEEWLRNTDTSPWEEMLEEMRPLLAGDVLAIEDVGADVEREAKNEVERIIAIFMETGDVNGVLGHGTVAEKRAEFRRLSKFLHPDKKLVRGDRADMALRMIYVAHRASK